MNRKRQALIDKVRKVGPGWMSLAACSGMESDVFFPPIGDNGREAKRVCAGCPVQSECFDYAIAYNLEDGFWGGTSGRYRRTYRTRNGYNDDLPRAFRRSVSAVGTD